jgi:hypothetical protein
MDPQDLEQPQTASPGPIDQINLTRVKDRFLVHPPAHVRLPPFVLPTLPMSVTNRCVVMAHSFWVTHRRCIGFLLLLDLMSHNWGCGIPTQRCSADSACWSVNKGDFDDMSASCAVAGSFQSRVVRQVEELADAPPPCPGLHLVLRVGCDHPGPEITTFVRADGVTQPIDPDAVLFDDWSASLTQFRNRLTLM